MQHQRSKGTAKEKAHMVAAAVEDAGGQATISRHAQGITVRLKVKDCQGVVRWDKDGRYDYPKSALNGKKVRNVSELLRRVHVVA